MANNGVSITVDSKELWKKFQKVDKEVKKVVEDYVKEESLAFQKDIRKTLTNNNSVITGNLKRSITIKKVHKYEYKVGTNVKYAPYVEFGTRRANAKPYFQPVINSRGPKFRETIIKLIREAIA